MRKITSDFIAKVSILSALAGILLFVKFPIPIAPSFYKLEFSDVPALLGGFALGPSASIIICLMKNLINIALEGTTTAFVGELSNFLMSCSLCVPAAMIYEKIHSKTGAYVSMFFSIALEALFSCLINYFVLIPAYVFFMHYPLEAIISLGTGIFPGVINKLTLILYCTLPFNVIKSLSTCVITAIVYKRISPLLHSR